MKDQLTGALIEEARPVTEKQKLVLANMYANDDFRGYLIHAAQVANGNALRLLKSGDKDSARDYSIRADAIEMLLNKAKLYFIHYDKIKKLSTEGNG